MRKIDRELFMLDAVRINTWLLNLSSWVHYGPMFQASEGRAYVLDFYQYVLSQKRKFLTEELYPDRDRESLLGAIDYVEGFYREERISDVKEPTAEVRRVFGWYQEDISLLMLNACICEERSSPKMVMSLPVNMEANTELLEVYKEEEPPVGFVRFFPEIVENLAVSLQDNVLESLSGRTRCIIDNVLGVYFERDIEKIKIKPTLLVEKIAEGEQLLSIAEAILLRKFSLEGVLGIVDWEGRLHVAGNGKRYLES